MKTKLSTSMNLTQFDNGYWYAAELKEFAETIGIPSANKLRKDELETAIKHFLKTGKIKSPTKRSLSTPGPKDVELGLSLDLPVVVYTNDNFLSDFLAAEKGATREQAIKAWEQLKTLDIPKNYRSWAKSQSSKSR